MKLTARARLETWAHASRVQSDEVTYGLRMESTSLVTGDSHGSGGDGARRVDVGAMEHATRNRGVEMTDIVETLDRTAEWLASCNYNASALNVKAAAREIERLRAELSEVRCVVTGCGKYDGGTMRKLRAELDAYKETVDRLHHALHRHGLHPGRTDEDIIEIVDAKLAELAQRGEPVAWLNQDDAENTLWEAINNAGRIGNPTDDKLILEHLKKRGIWIGNYTAQPQRQQERAEPVAFLYRTSWGELKLAQTNPPPDNDIAVYTAPPQRKPLTDAQVVELIERADGSELSDFEFVRAIERAHGIGGEHEPR